MFRNKYLFLCKTCLVIAVLIIGLDLDVVRAFDAFLQDVATESIHKRCDFILWNVLPQYCQIVDFTGRETASELALQVGGGRKNVASEATEVCWAENTMRARSSNMLNGDVTEFQNFDTASWGSIQLRLSLASVARRPRINGKISSLSRSKLRNKYISESRPSISLLTSAAVTNDRSWNAGCNAHAYIIGLNSSPMNANLSVSASERTWRLAWTGWLEAYFL